MKPHAVSIKVTKYDTQKLTRYTDEHIRITRLHTQPEQLSALLTCQVRTFQVRRKRIHPPSPRRDTAALLPTRPSFASATPARHHSRGGPYGHSPARSWNTLHATPLTAQHVLPLGDIDQTLNDNSGHGRVRTNQASQPFQQHLGPLLALDSRGRHHSAMQSRALAHSRETDACPVDRFEQTD